MIFMIVVVIATLFEQSLCQEQNDANFIILHTNDIHGWIDGHRHIPELDANIVDYYNFVQHTKELLTNHIVLAFDSGDQTQGTGLSDLTQIPGEFIFDMLKQVPIDGFTIGNHEMYNNSCIDNIANKVQIEMEGRYIVSNSHHVDQNKKLGEKYKIINIKGFGSILVFGYIFSFTGYMDHANVTAVPEAIKEEWFKDILTKQQQQNDEYALKLVILLIHCDPANSETDLIVNQIREYRPDVPILVLGGHSHNERIVMKSHQIESQKNDSGKDIRIESLCYFQEFGLLQFSISYDNNTENAKINKQDFEKLNDIHNSYRVYNPSPIKQQDSIQSNQDDNERLINMDKSNVNGFISSLEIDFIRSQVQYMQSALKQLCRLDQPQNVSDSIVWDYAASETMRKQIKQKNEELKINEIVGCSDQTYGNDITDKVTLFDLLTNKVYPKLKPFNRNNNNNNNNKIIISTAYIVNSGSQRSPLYQGQVTKDDIISIDPLGNTFCAFRGVNGQDMRSLINSKIKAINNESNEQDIMFTDHYIITKSVVELIKDKDKDSDHEYDIIASSYDCPRISEVFQSMNTSTEDSDIKYPIYNSDIILLSILKEYVIKYMKCSNSKTTLFSWIIAIIIIILLVIAVIIIISLLLFIFWHRIRSNRARAGLIDDLNSGEIEKIPYQQI